MPGRRKDGREIGFGERLAALRKAAGYTQVELAEEVGLSQRMVAYYESPRAHAPTDLLPALARALGVSIETLLGTEPVPRSARAKNSRLDRRLKEIEKLGAREKRQIMQLLDTFLEREKLKRRIGGQTERAA